jgi:hypothetical protein
VLLLREEDIWLLEIRMLDLPMNLAGQAVSLIKTLLDRQIGRRAVGQAIQRVIAVLSQQRARWRRHGCAP